MPITTNLTQNAAKRRGDSLTPFFLLCLIGFAAFFSSYLRIPVMPLFAATLGAGPAQVGMINGAFMLTAGIFSIPGGLLADRVGRKLPIVTGVVATAASSLLVTQCHLPGQMAAAYILFGAGLAAFAPAMLSLVAEAVPSDRLGHGYGWYTTSTYIAMTVGPASGGYLAKAVGLRQVFAVSALLSVAAALLAFLLLPRDTPRRRTELHLLLAGSFGLLQNRGLIAALLATAGSCLGFGVFLTFLPLYASLQGHGPAQVGLIFAAQAITNVVGRAPIGKLADRVDRRRLVAGGLILLTAALVMQGMVTQLALFLANAVLMGIGMALTFTTIGAMIADLTPVAQRGLAMGMYNSCIYLGMMTGAAVMGLLLKWIGYPLGFAAAGGVNMLTLALFYLLTRERGPHLTPPSLPLSGEA